MISRAKRLAVFCSLLGVSGAWAQTTGTWDVSGRTATYVPPPQTMPGATRWAPTVTSGPNGSVLLKDLLKMPSQAGTIADIEITRQASASAVRHAAARALARGIPYVGAGILIWDVYSHFRMKPDGNGGILYDPGLPPDMTGAICTQSTPSFCGNTQGEALTAFTGYLNQQAQQQTVSCGYGQPAIYFTPTYYSVSPNVVKRTVACGQPDIVVYTLNFTGQLTPHCEVGEIGVDGKCPTPDDKKGQNPPILVPPNFAGDYWDSHPSAQDPPLPDVARGSSGAGENPETTPGPAPNTSGPPSAQGQPKTTTTTNPDGSTTTTTTTQQTTYTYNDNKVIWNITNITTTYTTPPGWQPGDPTPDPTTTTEEQPEEDPEDPCTANPDRLGCLKLGEPPASEGLPRENVPIDLTDVPFAKVQGCPTAVPFAVYGKSYAISFEPLCDVMSWLRPIFLALGAAAAAFIFVQGFRV